MSSARVILSTIDNEIHAEQIARTLVGERLAACVSIIPRLTSIYRWQGVVEQEQETLMIIKTTSDKVAGAIAKIKEMHPYEVPELLSLPVDTGFQPYLDWIAGETRPQEQT